MPSPLFFPIPLAGRLYDGMLGAGSLTTLAVAANTLYATPLFIPDTITVSALGVEVTTFATGNVRLGLYYDLAGQPGTLLLDGGATSTGTSNGFKSVAVSQALSAGTWWLAAVFDATPTVRAITTANSLHALGFSSGTDTNIHSGISVAFTYAVLPTPFTGGSALYTGNFPRLMVQI